MTHHRTLWSTAVATFGVGDVVTTSIGVHQFGLPELNPLYVALFDLAGVVPSLLVSKALGFLALYALYLRMDSHSWLIPAGVTFMGLLISSLNLAALFIVSAGGAL